MAGIGKGHPLTDGFGMQDLSGPSNNNSTNAQHNGGYAYSTTLRRQASNENHHFHHLGIGRPASPHLGSPYRKRNASLENPNLPTMMEEDGSVFQRLMNFGRRITGKREYHVLEGEEFELKDEPLSSKEETPSAIYSHKSIEVSHFAGAVTDDETEHHRTH